MVKSLTPGRDLRGRKIPKWGWDIPIQITAPEVGSRSSQDASSPLQEVDWLAWFLWYPALYDFSM